MKIKKKNAPSTENYLQKDREKSVIRRIHNGIQQTKGTTRKEKIEKYFSKSIVPNPSSLNIAKEIVKNFEDTLINLVSRTSETGMYRLSKPLLIEAILVKQQKKKVNVTQEMIKELIGKEKKELIIECKK